MHCSHARAAVRGAKAIATVMVLLAPQLLTAGSPSVSMRSMPHGASPCTLSLRATLYRSGEESPLSVNDVLTWR
jgi:hypothetical protein